MHPDTLGDLKAAVGEGAWLDAGGHRRRPQRQRRRVVGLGADLEAVESGFERGQELGRRPAGMPGQEPLEPVGADRKVNQRA